MPCLTHLQSVFKRPIGKMKEDIANVLFIAICCITPSFQQAIPDAIVIENDIKKSTLPVIDLPAPTAPPVAPTTRAPPISSTTSRNPLLASVKLPCSCKGRECGCCTGLVLERFRQKACFNTTYDPDEFQVNAAITLNNRVLYKNSISGKNPPPMCVNLPRIRFIEFCVELSNVYLANRNMHMCVNMGANWEGYSLLEFNFDCLRMGANGVAILKPEEGGGIRPPNEEDEEDEDYDENVRTLPANEASPTYSAKGDVLHFSTEKETVTVKRIDKGDYLYEIQLRKRVSRSLKNKI